MLVKDTNYVFATARPTKGVSVKLIPRKGYLSHKDANMIWWCIVMQKGGYYRIYSFFSYPCMWQCYYFNIWLWSPCFKWGYWKSLSDSFNQSFYIQSSCSSFVCCMFACKFLYIKPYIGWLLFTIVYYEYLTIAKRRN